MNGGRNEKSDRCCRAKWRTVLNGVVKRVRTTQNIKTREIDNKKKKKGTRASYTGNWLRALWLPVGGTINLRHSDQCL